MTRVAWRRAFFFQFGVLSSMIYYNMLALYFFLTIRCNISSKVIEERMERWMHAIAVGWSTFSAIVGLFVESYHPLGLYQGCWRTVANRNIATWVFMTPWLVTSYVIIPILFIIMYRGAWKAYRGSLLRQSIHITGQRQRSITRASSQQAKRLQMLRDQAFLYVVAFFATYSFIFAGQIVENYATNPRHLIQKLYPLLVLESIMTPLAGFFNCLVYLRPRYPHWRDGFQTDSTTCGSGFFRLLRHSSSYFTAGTGGTGGTGPLPIDQAAIHDHNNINENKNDHQQNNKNGDRNEDKLQDLSSDLAPYDMNVAAPEEESYVENTSQEFTTFEQNGVEEAPAPH